MRRIVNATVGVLLGWVGVVIPTAAPEAATDGSADAAAQQAVSFNVVTYNIRWGQPCVEGSCNNDPPPASDLVGIANTIMVIGEAQGGLDIVTLQEVAQFDRRFGCVDQPRQIALYLSEMTGLDWDFEMVRTRMGPNEGTECADSSPSHYTGNAILSPHDINNPQTTPLPQRSDDTTDPSESCEPARRAQRCVLSALVRVPDTGGVVVHTTHLASNGPAEGQEVREAQVRELLKIWGNPPSDTPTLLTGDFNFDREIERELYGMILDSGYTDAGGNQCTSVNPGNCTYSSVNPVRRIDYIFLSSLNTPSLARAYSSQASDHLPVGVTPIAST